jgi:hypothetical protein
MFTVIDEVPSPDVQREQARKRRWVGRGYKGRWGGRGESGMDDMRICRKSGGDEWGPGKVSEDW